MTPRKIEGNTSNVSSSNTIRVNSPGMTLRKVEVPASNTVTVPTITVDSEAISQQQKKEVSVANSRQERPEQTNLYGDTGEDDLPESRTELNEESGVSLPSVNNLKAMFSRTGVSDDSSIKRVRPINTVFM